MSRVLAILGGTFDPIHSGHLRAAIEAREALGAEELRLIPCAVPPHRPQPQASPKQRLAMLSAAVAGVPGLSTDARELERSGPSYTFDTLVGLRAEVGERPIVLVLGADAFAGLPSWYRWTELINYAHIAVLTRPDAHSLIDPRLEALLAQVGTADAADVTAEPAGRVLRLEIPPMPVSSTLIRTRLQQQRSVRYLVPDPVIDLIDAWRLYRAPPVAV
jgi:nicotinate-nucleotide adenylyltransferase